MFIYDWMTRVLCTVGVIDVSGIGLEGMAEERMGGGGGIQQRSVKKWRNVNKRMVVRDIQAWMHTEDAGLGLTCNEA